MSMQMSMDVCGVQGSPAKRAKRDDGFMLGGHDGGVKPDGNSGNAAQVLKLKQTGISKCIRSYQYVATTRHQTDGLRMVHNIYFAAIMKANFKRSDI